MYIPKNKNTQIINLVKKYGTKTDYIFSVDDFLDVIRSNGYEIDTLLSDLSEDSQAIKGFYISKQDGSYDVVLLRELNYCWKRLVLCKELCHVLLDAEEHRSMNIPSLIEEAAGVVITEIKPSNAMLSEVMAEVAAMELLFPYRNRVQELRDQVAFSEIAQKYKCPLILVEKYLFEKNMSDLKSTFS